MCYERAEKAGHWVMEDWVWVYFYIWEMFMVWELLDDDPFFTMEDRRIIEEVLWGYTCFAQGRHYLDEQYNPPNEPRQNHLTYLALGLNRAHRYYTEKYGITGLDSIIDKVKLTFEMGAASSYRPNDDGGATYRTNAPLHYLTYAMEVGDESFFANGRMRSYIDLLVATTDNRQDGVSYGDVGRYTHRTKGSRRIRELKFFEMAAWYYREGQYQWFYNWLAKDSIFNLSNLFGGTYAVDIKEEEPARYLGIFPVILDNASLRWISRRSENESQLPLTDKQYFDKLSFRTSFDPQDEYLLVDGTSTFAHGHYDGNTVTRLTWKDRVWLFDFDYLKFTPKYHNGVIVVRDGIQHDPPPLNVLDYKADFSTFGFTRTTSRNFSGADWERNIIWRKGNYFLFLDRVTARKSGDYRFECRWRTRGDVGLLGNTLSVQQGDKSFFIKSADDAHRDIVIEPDGDWNRCYYPYGDGQLSICLARKNMVMSQNSVWTYSNLMYAVDDSDPVSKDLYKVLDGLYLIKDNENQELVGLCADVLLDEGLYTDCSLFVKDSRNIWLVDTTTLKFGDVYFESPGRVQFEIDFKSSTGKLVVPETSEGTFRIRNITFRDAAVRHDGQDFDIMLSPGTYQFTFTGDMWRNDEPFRDLTTAANRIIPSPPSDKFVDFGIDLQGELEVTDTVTALSHDRDELIFADSNGRITRYDGSNSSVVFQIPSKNPLLSVHIADINGDG
ncbi:hypothetical protein ACFL5B_04070, partial [Candidatus Latescibacterota bacterium]